MPIPYRREHPGKPEHRMQDAAKAGQLIRVRCNLCHRTIYYLASDLVDIVGPNYPAHTPPFPCSKCGPSYLNVKLHIPATGDYGHLIVRRPGEVKRIQKWQNVPLG